MTLCSLPEIVGRNAARNPSARAYTFLESGERESETLTWRMLDERSRSLASVIRRTVRRGARVLLLFPPGLEFVVAFFASLRAGTIAVPAYPPSGHRAERLIARLRGMVGDAGVSLVVAPQAVCVRREAVAAAIPGLGGIPWLNSTTVASATRSSSDREAGPTDVALLQYTSGSTSDPRGVMVTHANLLHNLQAAAELAAHTQASVAVSWLPVNHDMGLIDGILQPAYSGFPVWLMAPAAFLQRPERWLQAISRLRATHSGGPNFAYELCARRVSDNARRALDLTTWQTAYSGSEPIRSSTLQAFHRVFAECGFRWDSFRPAYGLAECTLLVSSTARFVEPEWIGVNPAALALGQVDRTDSDPGAVWLVSCGRPAAGMRVEVVDPNLLVRSVPGAVGEIWIAGPSVAAGYWNRPEASSATFGAHLESGDGPFLRTGDLGVVLDGNLFVTGRIKDVLIVRGLKHYPQDVELTAERAHPAVRYGGCAAVPAGTGSEESVTIYAEVDASLDWQTVDRVHAADAERICAAIASAVTDGHGFSPAEVVLVPSGTLPRTTSGKLQRFQCASEFARTLPLHRWTAAEHPTRYLERVAS